MSSKVFLNLGSGNINIGFDRISCRLERDGKIVVQMQGGLPGNSGLQSLYDQWQFCYEAYYDNHPNVVRGNRSGIEIDNTGVTGRYSEPIFQEDCNNLEQSMQRWLNDNLFYPIDCQLRNNLHIDENIAIFIETEDDRVHRLPWHSWSILTDFSRAEVAFSLNNFEQRNWSIKRKKPRILVVLGERTGLNTTSEIQSIQQLGADPIFLIEPNITQLNEKLNEREGWDILFFAGHSSSSTRSDGTERQVGSIHLNAEESVTLVEINNALESAIRRGLKLAIFNSCSGLGLATNLAELNIPTVIVMREAIPNQVAQDFLRVFLSSFAAGSPLLWAVREAKQQLQGIEREFPCATWLPVVFCNPSVELPTWRSFYSRLKGIKWGQLGVISVVTTATIWGMRSQGYLEWSELAAYDLAMNTRVIPEDLDPRILIVKVTEDDFQKYGKNEPLRDYTIVDMLRKLQRYQPKVIGLDIYRDQEFKSFSSENKDTGHKDLVQLLQQEQNQIISPCLMQVSENIKDYPGVSAPTGIKPEQLGFTNFVSDRRDSTIRRQLLGMAPTEYLKCNTDHAFSFRLALRYLDVKEAQENDQGNIKIGSQELEVLKGSVGAYRSGDAQENLLGYQIMLNYRNNPTVATQVSLDDVLHDRVSREMIANKVILIGYTGQSVGDFLKTAYDGDPFHQSGSRMPGVIIHAHMVSNILSHVLDRRPLLKTWSDTWELLWIWVWGATGGVILLYFRGHKILLVGGVVVLCIIYISCFNFCLIWIPLVPSGISLVLTPLVVRGFHKFQTRSLARNQNYVSEF